MHPLMRTILLGVTACNPPHEDSEPDPPHRQRREPRHAGTGKWRSVVGPDLVGKAVDGKQPSKRALRLVGGWPEKRATSDQVPAEAVHHGQGITPPTVSGPKLAFVVGGPDDIRGRACAGVVPGRRPHPSTHLSRWRELMVRQQTGDWY